MNTIDHIDDVHNTHRPVSDFHNTVLFVNDVTNFVVEHGENSCFLDIVNLHAHMEENARPSYTTRGHTFLTTLSLSGQSPAPHCEAYVTAIPAFEAEDVEERRAAGPQPA